MDLVAESVESLELLSHKSQEGGRMKAVQKSEEPGHTGNKEGQAKILRETE